jgi:hypothetical protein
LTDAGRDADAAVREIEGDLYTELEQAMGEADPGPVIEMLQRFSAGSPAGRGLQNRIAAESALKGAL